MPTSYGFCRTMPVAYDEAVSLTIEALEKRGFEIVSRIDAQSLLQETLQVECRPYMALGAFSPDLSYQALQIESELGLLMIPCDIVVIDAGNGHSTVGIVDPIQALAPAKNNELKPIADALNRRLFRAYLDIVVQAAKREHLGRVER